MYKSKEYYKNIIQTKHDYKVMLKNFSLSYLSGGLLCLIGQIIFDFYNNILIIDTILSQTYMTLTIITITAIMTAIGIYDDIGQIGKCGLSIPISGFSNAAISSSIEYHKEGLVTGIGLNTLKLVGSVIVLGTFSAIVVSSIRYLIAVIL